VPHAKPLPPAESPPSAEPLRLAEPLTFDTARLAFRVWDERHRAPFAALNADPEVMRHFPATLTADQTDAGIAIWRGQFADRGWSNWAVERRADGRFIGFIGLSIPRRAMPFGPCVEIGWRLARDAWGQGYATEGALTCLDVAFAQLGLAEVVSFTALTNLRSIAVMKRIGLRNAQADFEHPGVPEGHPLRMHCLYRIARPEWQQRSAPAAG
jgi:RimJ/RimL family protein N-acetyltransferase